MKCHTPKTIVAVFGGESVPSRRPVGHFKRANPRHFSRVSKRGSGKASSQTMATGASITLSDREMQRGEQVNSRTAVYRWLTIFSLCLLACLAGYKVMAQMVSGGAYGSASQATSARNASPSGRLPGFGRPG